MVDRRDETRCPDLEKAYHAVMHRLSRTISICVLGISLTAPSDEPVIRMLVPGFNVQELPVKLSNQNSLRFAPDGALTSLGYDGRVHILRDTNGDGLEDSAETFWDKTTITVPVGIAWSTNGLYVSSHGKVSLLRDSDGDGKADEEEVVASGWPPTDVGSGGVDATSVVLDPEGNVYFGLLTADYSNPYRVKDGVSRYSTNHLRGTIQKFDVKTRKLETIATGIRVPYALAFNKAGDLFNTDQEGETWCPDGNPLDELNHIVRGKNYGFPPRHEKWLPDLVSEPPVVGFGPQHQSTCGFVFNEPENKNVTSPGCGLFGPAWWEGDALVTGESRGKIWRVKLHKTASGYIGKEFLIARLSMLTMDVAISPQGDLYVCCHSGKPDWGTGPKGDGKIFKISYTDPAAPQPISTWVTAQNEVRVAFDRPVDESITNRLPGMDIEFGEFVSAADRYEILKPPYKVVAAQEKTPRSTIKVFSARLEGDRTLRLTTAPHPLAARYALTIPGVKAEGNSGGGESIDVDYSLTGVRVTAGSQEGKPRISLQRDYRPDWLPDVPPATKLAAESPELAGGDFQRGKKLFFGDKLKCGTCHRIRGEGNIIAPDLSNLPSRDPGSILRDIRDPGVTMHPDYVAFNVSLHDGETVSGFVRAQKEEWLTVLGVDGKETTIAQTNVASLRASAVSLMPAGLLDGVKESEVRDLLVFLSSEPPQRTREEVVKLLGKRLEPTPPVRSGESEKPSATKLVWVAGKQDHGKGEHDYPSAQRLWVSLLSKASGFSAETAWNWPTESNWNQAAVLVFYCWNHSWTSERLTQLDKFLQRGGGLVLIHAAVISDDNPERLAETIGLAAQPKRSKYLHTPLRLKFQGTNNFTQSFPKEIAFLDEPYWPLIGEVGKVNVIGTVRMEGKDWPQIWSMERGEGRVFATVLGHYTWTHEDPFYQALVLRGIAWAAKKEVRSLEKLVLD